MRRTRPTRSRPCGRAHISSAACRRRGCRRWPTAMCANSKASPAIDPEKLHEALELFEMARFTARPKKRGTPQGKTALGAFQGAARRRHPSPARTRRSRARLCRYACRRTMTIRHCVRAAAIHAATGSIGGCCSAIPNNACDFAFCEGRVAQFMRRCCELQRACAPVF